MMREAWAEQNCSKILSRGILAVPGQVAFSSRYSVSVTRMRCYAYHKERLWLGGGMGGRGEKTLRYPSLKEQADHTHSMFILGIGLAPTNLVSQQQIAHYVSN
jgi:hypothetical protein